MNVKFGKPYNDSHHVNLWLPADAETLYDSGQCFNMYWKEDKGGYALISGNRICYVRPLFFLPEPHMSVKAKKEDVAYWLDYFRVYDNLDQYLDLWKTDENSLIRKSALFADRQKLILLKQDLWETTVSFIISQRKNIPAIRKSLAAIRIHLGNKTDTEGLNTLPQPGELLKRKNKLPLCSLGYRENYLVSAARAFSDGMEEKLLEAEGLQEHMRILMQIKGVGEKVASCICLFALGDMEAFPKDVWINRIMDRLPENIFRYRNAGFLQQVLFYYITQHKDRFGKITNQES